MRTSWLVTCLLGACLAAQVGCRNTGPDLRPPKQEDQYNLPPANDSRFDRPPPTPPDPDNPTSSGKRGALFSKGGGGGMRGGMPGGF